MIRQRQRPVRVAGLPIAGTAVAALVLAVMAGALWAVLWRAGGAGSLRAPDWAAVTFSLSQAALSALVSVALAVPAARALARRQFAGRGLLIAALGAPFLLPVIVAALGIIALYGRSGLVSQGLAALGLPTPSIYGFQGVVLAHVFLNMPLAVRMLLHGWQAVPAERIRLAQSLNLGPMAQLRHIEWPMLRGALPGALLAVFLICLTSFTIVLILGGGPKATTIELAIYQAVRFDFDLGRAALLAGVQLVICVLAVALAARWAAPDAVGAGLDRPLSLPAPAGWRRLFDGALLTAMTLFLLSPLVVVIARGLPALPDLPRSVWEAAATSVILSLGVAFATGAATLALASAAARQGRLARIYETVGMLPMAASGLVLGTGLFVILHPLIAPSRLALPVTGLVNVLMALPFALRLVLPAWRAAESTQGRLADSLGLRGWSRLRQAILPRLRRPLGLALGLSATLAMGDLGVIALFANDEGATLPLQVWRLMGSYRTSLAEAAALLLVLSSFGVFLLFDLWGRAGARR